MGKIFKFSVPSMCSGCIEPVKNTFRNKSWVLNADGSQEIVVNALKINVLRKTFDLEIDSEGLDDTAIRNFLINELDQIGIVAGDEAPHLFKGIIGVVGGAGFLMLSLFGGGLPIIATSVLTGLSTVLSLYIGKEIFLEAYRKITQLHTLEMNALFSASALIAMTVSIASIFVPWLPCMLEAALLTFGFRHLGITLENRAMDRVIESSNFKKRTPSKVLVKNAAGQFELRHINDIEKDDFIRVNSGELVPVDGICLNENTRLDMSIITGSVFPKLVQAGFKIDAGMKVKSFKPLDIKVTAPAAESYLARLDDAILEAEIAKAPLEDASQTILKYFVPTLFLLSFATAGVAGMLFGTVMAIKCAVTLLVSACPCTLGSIIPLGVTVALEKASREDVLYRSGKALQAAAETDIVIFDLNGTLTEGDYSVSNVSFMTELTPEKQDQLYNCLYALEKDSSHSIAGSIQKYLTSLGYPKSGFKGVSQALPGTTSGGIRLRIDDENYYVGNRTLMTELGIDLNNYSTIPVTLANEQMIFFAKENELTKEKILINCITLNDPLKQSAGKVIDELKKMGKDVRICTGGDSVTALSYAAKLNIPPDKVYANCISMNDTTNPKLKTKSSYIEDLKTNHHKTVAMIGDALNDALAFKASDLGIYVKSQASADSLEAEADAIIQNSSLLPLLASFEIGGSMVQNIQQNLTLSFIYNFAALGIITCFACCAGIVLSPGAGVMMMIAQASLILLNVYRFKQQDIFYAQPKASEELNNTTIYRELDVSPTKTISHQAEPPQSSAANDKNQLVTAKVYQQTATTIVPSADHELRANQRK